MKRSIYAVISLMMAMVVGFTACGDDDKGFSAEQIAYFEKNLEFIREKKVLKGDDGELLYKQVVLGGDTALYRVLGKEGEETQCPTSQTPVTMILKGDFQRPEFPEGDDDDAYSCWRRTGVGSNIVE